MLNGVQPRALDRRYPPTIETLSNVAAAVRLVSWLATARPTQTSPERFTVSVPTVDHDEPSEETDAVIACPARVKRTQRGTTPVTCVLRLTSPVASRR